MKIFDKNKTVIIFLALILFLQIFSYSNVISAQTVAEAAEVIDKSTWDLLTDRVSGWKDVVEFGFDVAVGAIASVGKAASMDFHTIYKSLKVVSEESESIGNVADWRQQYMDKHGPLVEQKDDAFTNFFTGWIKREPCPDTNSIDLMSSVPYMIGGMEIYAELYQIDPCPPVDQGEYEFYATIVFDTVEWINSNTYKWIVPIEVWDWYDDSPIGNAVVIVSLQTFEFDPVSGDWGDNPISFKSITGVSDENGFVTFEFLLGQYTAAELQVVSVVENDIVFAPVAANEPTLVQPP